MFNFKKTCAVAALAAITVVSSSAFAKTEYPCSGEWKYGTGDGKVYSKYECYVHAWSHASVKNSKGKTDSDTKNWDQASASVKSTWRTDYAYYDCWD